jgi:tetratricopeptide (TPR) repeat protein
MNDKLNQTGIENSTFGNDAQISIEQTIILPFVPKQVKENPHNLPNSGVAQFVGRDDVLTQLDQQLQQNDRVAISTLTGMGGIGKSELALQYAWQEWPKETYRGGICWLNVADSDPGLSILSFANSYLGLTLPEEGELVERVRFVWQGWLKNEQDQCLIIFDDVRDYQKIKDYLPPQTDQRFKVIITTRLKELSAKIQTLHVDILQPEAALDLLRSYVTDRRIDDQLEQANLLCRDLGYLPLALELVARLLRRRTNWTVAKIREKLAEKGLADQSLIKNPKFDSEMTAERGVKAAFDLSWQELDSEPNAQKLAMYLSLFALAPFPKTLIDGLFPEVDEDEIEEWLTDSLVHLNLVKPLGDGWYELHTLIRHYLRDKLEVSEVMEAAKKAYGAVMVKVAKNIEKTLTLEDIAYLDPLIDHLKIVAEELNQWLEDEDLAWPFTGLGRFYEGQVLYNEAIPYLEQCLKLTEERFGADHYFVAISLNNLAALYESQGRYAEAKPLYLRSLSIIEKQLGADHPDVANSLNNLAGLYLTEGRYAEAEPLYLRSLSIMEKQLGADHPYVAISLNNLAALYRTQGRYAEAEPLYLRSLSIGEKQLGADHPYVANSLNNLGLLYDTQGRYAEAEPLYLRSLSIGEKQLGADHPLVAQGLNNLAGLYRTQGRYTEAEPLCLRSLSIMEKQLGADHPDFAQGLNNLGLLYDTQGRYAEVEPLYLRSLSIMEKQLGADHPYVANSLNNLAELYRTQGRYTEAEPLYLRSLSIGEKQLGADHPLVAQGLNNLALLYESQGRYAEAEPLYLRSLSIGEKQLGADHLDFAQGLNNLAELYRTQGRYAEAEPLYLRSLSIREKQLGSDHPLVATSLNNLALLYASQGRYAEAEPLYQRALQICEQNLGIAHPSTMTVRGNYAKCLKEWVASRQQNFLL